MKKNKLKKYKKVFLYFLVIFLISIAVLLKESSYYNEVLVEKAYEVSPSNQERQGIVFKKTDYFLDKDGNKVGSLSLIPGEVYESVFFVKNHFLSSQNLTFVLFGDFDSKEESYIPVEFSGGNNFMLEAGEWKLIPYTIVIPADFVKGSYVGTIAVKNQQVYKHQNGTNIVLAVANEFNIDVVDVKNEYDYVSMVDKELSPHKIAMNYIYSDLKKVVSYAFALLAVLFLYQAYIFDKKKK